MPNDSIPEDQICFQRNPSHSPQAKDSRSGMQNNRGDACSPSDSTVSLQVESPEANSCSKAQQDDIHSQSWGDSTVSIGDKSSDRKMPAQSARSKHKVNAKTLQEIAFYSSEDEIADPGDVGQGKAIGGVKRKRNESRLEDDLFTSDSSQDDDGDVNDDAGSADGDSVEFDPFAGDSDDDDDDNDDSMSDGGNSVYQLQNVCMKTNEVGVESLVCVAQESTTDKQKKKIWGKIVRRCSKEVFDVQYGEKVLRNVSIADMMTMESRQLKDSKLSAGNKVYAPWPGTENPATDSYFWGRINEVKIGSPSGDSKKHYSILFFPTPDSHGLVDITDDLDSEFIYREKEAIFLMQNAVLRTDDLPSSHEMSLEELIDMRREQQEPSKPKQKRTAKKKAKAPSATKPPKPRRRAPSKPRTKRRNAASKISERAQSSRIMDPANESKLQLSLESQDFKDSMLQVDEKVYAPHPGEDPQRERYYWGRITKVFKSNNTKNLYRIDFPDGDRTEKVESFYLHRYLECMRMMENGWLAEDKPPKNL
ncbi:unnamed protein product [Cylindrotheca closterium]|uniref:Uncharacterized protein n=1 Tax=Cylindrotheca closterium TaxID=2856 RepID=A0AAD2FY16_9STRA|nr:unnamed protein product [Cylindrotheca closterium]